MGAVTCIMYVDKFVNNTNKSDSLYDDQVVVCMLLDSPFTDVKFMITEKEERLLARRLLIFANVLDEAIETYSPHRLCNYLHSLAASFASFYENCPVLKAPNADIRASRLALCDLTAKTLNLGLDLLGINSPEEM